MTSSRLRCARAGGGPSVSLDDRRSSLQREPNDASEDGYNRGRGCPRPRGTTAVRGVRYRGRRAGYSRGAQLPGTLVCGRDALEIIDCLIATFYLGHRLSALHRERDFDPFEDFSACKSFIPNVHAANQTMAGTSYTPSVPPGDARFLATIYNIKT